MGRHKEANVGDRVISGAHSILYSRNPEADRAFLKDVLGLPHVDVGHGWLIFALPPAEVAVHPGEESRHELYFMVEDHAAFIELMQARGIACTAPRDLGWGVLTQATLPGGGSIGVYEPRHARPTVESGE
jgi:catechol 2,3-dioxygenase-like lactoylglutathione lyase family enzyme